MPAPVQNTQVVAQGQARLTSAYVAQPNVRAWLGAMLSEAQTLENVFFDILQARILSTATEYALPATNVVFDSIGALVGLSRGGLSDAQYKSAIYLRIAVNRSTGAVPDWSNFAAILLPWGDGVFYLDGQAAIRFGVWDLGLDPNVVAQLLAQAPGNGIGGVFEYTTWPDGNDFEFGSRYSASAGQGTWGSRYSASTGGVFVAGAAL